jgi:acetolactate synthase-1/2/3 large subunit
MATYLGADLIVESLAREGVRHVFSVPGGQMIPIHYAIDEHESMELVVGGPRAAAAPGGGGGARGGGAGRRRPPPAPRRAQRGGAPPLS